MLGVMEKLSEINSDELQSWTPLEKCKKLRSVLRFGNNGHQKHRDAIGDDCIGERKL